MIGCTRCEMPGKGDTMISRKRQRDTEARGEGDLPVYVV